MLKLKILNHNILDRIEFKNEIGYCSAVPTFMELNNYFLISP